METKDVTDTFKRLFSLRRTVERGVVDAVADSCAWSPPLFGAVNRLLRSDGGDWTHYRLLPLALHAALTGDPEPAVPVAVLSWLWWTGAETLDDIADGEFDRERIGVSPAQAMIAAIACTSLIPQVVVDRAPVTPATARAWKSELVSTSLSCAAGQLDDLARDGETSWARTMRCYAGKTGAPYERDAVLTALLAGQDTDAVRAWRAFGRLFGVLRQLANDHADDTAVDAADLSNGVRTLLVSHLVESTRPAEPAGTHRLLLDGSVAPELITSYLARVDTIVNQLSALLERLAPPSDHRDVVQWLINRSTDTIRSANVAPARDGREGPR